MSLRRLKTDLSARGMKKMNLFSAFVSPLDTPGFPQKFQFRNCGALPINYSLFPGSGLEFLPTGEESAPARGFTDASVVSISVDHQVDI